MDFAVRPPEPDLHLVPQAPKRRRRRERDAREEAARDETKAAETHEHEEGVGERLDLTA